MTYSEILSQIDFFAGTNSTTYTVAQKTINVNNSNTVIPNSLGSKCYSPAYCGYMETRPFSKQARYYGGISQKSICVITKV